MIMREIHVHIPAGLADDQVIHIHLDDAEPQQQPATSDTIEGMLRRLETSPSASPQLRDSVAAFEAMGYELRLPKMHNKTGRREKYLRIMDPALTAHGTGYLRPGFLVLTRTSDRDALARLPGALVTGSNVRFPVDGQSELEAARQVKR
jgi:hypothetical protein